MRIRKQRKPGPEPGAEFLRAISSGPRMPKAAPPPETDDPALGQRLLDSERRAASAEEALRQIREESRQRLEEAREALALERSARIAAEEALARARDAAQRSGAHEEAVHEPDADPQPETPVEDHEYHGNQPGHPDGPPMRDTVPGEEGDAEDEWPTPWLGSGKRGLFRRG